VGWGGGREGREEEEREGGEMAIVGQFVEGITNDDLSEEDRGRRRRLAALNILSLPH
jgi:hypothetical protein